MNIIYHTIRYPRTGVRNNQYSLLQFQNTLMRGGQFTKRLDLVLDRKRHGWEEGSELLLEANLAMMVMVRVLRPSFK